jgi:1,4-dihydroxy-2-naphthoate octaprenyltransferase
MTLAVRLGRRGTRIEYAVCVGAAYAVVVGLGVAGMAGRWSWLPLLSLPLAVWLVRFIAQTEGRALNQALKRTGQLHLLFGLLFAAALWLG